MAAKVVAGDVQRPGDARSREARRTLRAGAEPFTERAHPGVPALTFFDGTLNP